MYIQAGIGIYIGINIGRYIHIVRCYLDGQPYGGHDQIGHVQVPQPQQAREAQILA
jgi:hypothetical protein